MKISFALSTLAIPLCIISIAAAQAPQVSSGPAQAIRTRNTPWPGSVLRSRVPISDAQRELGEQVVLLEKATDIDIHAGNYIQAEANEHEMFALSPFYAAGYGEEEVARTLLLEGKTVQAVAAYRKIVDEGNSSPRVLLPYALLMLQTGQWAPAVAAYEKALPHVPGDNTGTWPDYKLQSSPDDPEPTALAAAIHVALGLVYDGECDAAGESQQDTAMLEYSEALRLAPDWDAANYFYGYGLEQLGRTTEAAAAFRKTIKMSKGAVKIAAEKALAKQKKPV